VVIKIKSPMGEHVKKKARVLEDELPEFQRYILEKI